MMPVTILTASASGALPMLIPVLAIVLGIVILVAIAMGQSKQRSQGDRSVRSIPRTGYGLGIGFLVWGVLALIASFYSEQWYGVLAIWGLGVLFCWVGLGNIRLIFRCTQPIRATVEKHNRYSSRGASAYAPVLFYRYEGKDYHIQSHHGFSLGRVMRDFAVGSEVEIHVDPAAPEYLTLFKRVRAGDVFLLLFGFLFVGLGLLLLIANVPISF